MASLFCHKFLKSIQHGHIYTTPIHFCEIIISSPVSDVAHLLLSCMYLYISLLLNVYHVLTCMYFENFSYCIYFANGRFMYTKTDIAHSIVNIKFISHNKQIHAVY